MIWGLSLHGWEDVMRGSLAIVGVFGLLVGLATFFVVTLQREEISSSKQEFDKYKTEAAEQISEAQARTASATALAADATLKANRAATDAAEAQLALEKFKAPRSISPEQRTQIASELIKFGGQEFQGAVASSVADGHGLWRSIHAVLTESRWVFVPPSSMGFGVPPAAIPFAPNPGVVIFAPSLNSPTGIAARALAAELSALGVTAEAVEGVLGDNSSNAAMMAISVGPKP